MIKITSSTVVYSIKLGVATALAYYFGVYVSHHMLPILDEIGGLWSVISAVLVLRKGVIESFKSGLDRIFGTLIGCFIGALCLYFVNVMWFFPIAIVITTFICFSSRQLEKYFAAAALACSVVIIIWQLGIKANVWIYSLSRFIESAVGVGMALLIAHIPPFEKKKA